MIAVNELALRADVKTIQVHELAIETIQAMFDRCEQIKAVYGPQAPCYLLALTSLQHCLGNLFQMGFASHCYVTRDGELSLYVNEGDVFVFGIVFHRDRTSYPDGDPRRELAGEWSCHS